MRAGGGGMNPHRLVLCTLFCLSGIMGLGDPLAMEMVRLLQHTIGNNGRNLTSAL